MANINFILVFGAFIAFGSGEVLNVSKNSLPIVMWHGMGDTCCFSFSLGSFRDLLRDLIGPDTYIKSIRIGNNVIEDYESGYFVHPNKQVETVCREIADDPQLQNGYNAIGFSQGSQFLRAVAQRCPTPRIHNLISLGGQHQGVFGLPSCPSLSFSTCEHIRVLLNKFAYEKWLQDYLVQATYWHNPLKEDAYRAGSTFLADINNEKTINNSYIVNLNKLNRIVLVKFTEDTIVQPVDTEWFEFYEPNQDKIIQPLVQSRVADNLGLRKLIRAKKLVLLETKGNHLQFTHQWFVKNVLSYLNGAI